MRKIKSALLALALALGFGLSVATPARAAVSDCPLGNFCIWTGYNFSGTRYTIPFNTIYNGTRHGYRLGTLASNHGRSFYNHTTRSMNIYDSGTCFYNPWTRTLASNGYADARGSDWGDRVSSVQVEAYAPNC